MDNQANRNSIWQVLNNVPEGDIQQQPLCPPQRDDAAGCHRLCIGTDAHHSHVPVIPSLLALLIIQVALLATMFALPEFHETLSSATNSFSVLQYVYLVSWAVIALLSRYVCVELHEIWVLGYHSFYNNTKHLHTACFFIHTFGLVLMCLLGTVVRDYCTGGALAACGAHIHFSPVNYQQAVVLILTSVSLLFTIKLISDVYNFNQSELPADALLDDLGVRLSQATSYVGIGRPSNIRTVLEVQGAMIGSLRHRIDTLNKQMAVLANTLEEYMNR